MVTIRLIKREWARAWRAMIEVAPVRLIQDDPIYEVLPAHLDVLAARGFTYGVLPALARNSGVMARPIRSIDLYLPLDYNDGPY